MGVGRGGKAPLGFEIISKKMFFQFRGVKIKFHHFWPPHLEKIFGKSPTAPPPWKKSFRRPYLEHLSVDVRQEFELNGAVGTYS